MLAEQNGGQWRKAVADAGLDAAFYILRDRSRDAVMPWDIIDGGLKSAVYRAEFDKSLRAEWTMPSPRSERGPRMLPVIS